MRKMILLLLKKRAQAILLKFKPKIVAITGSVGKTSAKEAIALVLGVKHIIRFPKKNYNNEFGVPLTILGEQSPGRNPFGWVRIFWRSFFLATYPEVLVLEYGVDHPGDMDELLDIARPDVAVVTGMSTVHVANFPNAQALASEKAKIVASVNTGGCVILNEDDPIVREMTHEANERVIFYGSKSLENTFDDLTLATREDEHFDPQELFVVTRADVRISGAAYGRLELYNLVGYGSVMASLCALTVGNILEVDPADGMGALKKLTAAPGRLHPMAGIKGSLILDDSYNAAPAAMQNGLEALRAFVLTKPTARKIAVLGAMAELGTYSDQEHRLVGLKLAEIVDIFLAVGPDMRITQSAAIEAGMHPEATEWFATSEEAGRYLDRELMQGDIVYVKGSQSMRMERVIKDVMAEPQRASELLVRQEPQWLLKK